MITEATRFIADYGYWGIAGVVGLESMGIPLPGETILIAAAAWAAFSHQLSIELVIAAAAGGAIVGDSLGYLIGRRIGFPLLLRYGARIGATEARLKVGQYLFLRHGGKVVFFGRFMALLRTLAALLAGINQMPWPRFLFFNATGGIVWATVFGVGAYMFGSALHRITGPLAIGFALLGAAAALTGFVLARRHERHLLAEAERALPGPLGGTHRSRSPR